MPSVKANIPDLSFREILAGRFRLEQVLGEGSYGKVYKAMKRQNSSESARFYAIKVLLKADPKSREHEMQQRELRFHKQVSGHPNIVTLCGAFEENKFIFVVLELCEGSDLFTAIVDHGLFEGNDQLIKSSYVKILDAVHYCHQQGIFHRDLKPENILCSNDGRDIWLADFGLSTDRQACRDFGCGSGAYMSPECIRKETKNMVYSALFNDIWSLGVILVNIITQHNPWNSAQSSDPCYKAFLKDPNSLRDALSISDHASRLLEEVFNLNAASRITIPTLRREILLVDTFYAADDRVLERSPAIAGSDTEAEMYSSNSVAASSSSFAGEKLSIAADADPNQGNSPSGSYLRRRPRFAVDPRKGSHQEVRKFEQLQLIPAVAIGRNFSSALDLPSHTL
ncbi:kinase-like domain-containing protein [Rhodocollybia butyracea]|uniref:Kinase-like domain-containing protein n=1 Tax=Rhodocollybia butyracea TaxID=206335 RepID=A0A9P5Q9I5_9AGAR|nr:kinase-like domain-containing protein [Rhodocollybia butyracea]